MGTLDHYLEFLEHYRSRQAVPVPCRRPYVIKGSMRPPNAGKPTQTIDHTYPSLIRLDDKSPQSCSIYLVSY